MWTALNHANNILIVVKHLDYWGDSVTIFVPSHIFIIFEPSNIQSIHISQSAIVLLLEELDNNLITQYVAFLTRCEWDYISPVFLLEIAGGCQNTPLNTLIVAIWYSQNWKHLKTLPSMPKFLEGKLYSWIWGFKNMPLKLKYVFDD